MLTDAHMGEGGVKICSNNAHVVYGRSLSMLNALLKISIFPHNWASDWFHLLLTVQFTFFPLFYVLTLLRDLSICEAASWSK
jgi:hypothetical protein